MAFRWLVWHGLQSEYHQACSNIVVGKQPSYLTRQIQVHAQAYSLLLFAVRNKGWKQADRGMTGRGFYNRNPFVSRLFYTLQKILAQTKTDILMTGLTSFFIQLRYKINGRFQW